MTTELYFKTSKAKILKILVISLKNLVTECNFQFSKKKIKVVKLNVDRDVLLKLELYSDMFEVYNCEYKEERPLVLGINIYRLYKIFMNCNTNDIVEFTNKKSSGIMDIRFTNRNMISTYNFNLIELDVEEYKMKEEINYDTILLYNSTKLKKLFRNIKHLSKNIEIKTSNSKLFISCDGDFVKQETIISKGSGEKINDLVFIKDKKHLINQGVYDNDKLLSFSNCYSLCNDIKIFIKNDSPICLEYVLGDYGKINLLVSQI
jgi:proliferating cell nuclear antigen